MDEERLSALEAWVADLHGLCGVLADHLDLLERQLDAVAAQLDAPNTGPSEA